MDKISPIKERILQFIETMNITKSEFCKKTNISYANLKGISLKSEFGGTQIAEILSIFEEISPEWLLTGRGEMLRKGTSSDHIREVTKMVSVKAGEGIPLIPIEAVAGWNGVDHEGVTLSDCKNYYIPDLVSAGADYLIRVSGSSMYPKYSSGDILACKKINEVTFFQWGKIYVIDSAQGAMVKRILPSEKDNCVVCKSDNDKYPPFELPKTEIRSLSIVIGAIRLE